MTAKPATRVPDEGNGALAATMAVLAFGTVFAVDFVTGGSGAHTCNLKSRTRCCVDMPAAVVGTDAVAADAAFQR